jgi:hypothetical protein
MIQRKALPDRKGPFCVAGFEVRRADAMTQKSEIVKCLGESAVLLPGLIAAALAANDRLKLRLTLLQAGVAHLQNPQSQIQDFAAERHGARLDDFDRLVSGARALDDGRGVLPGAALLIAGLRSDLAAMLAPLATARLETAHQLATRLTELQKALPEASGDEIRLAVIADMASARREHGDSVHLLVMQLPHLSADGCCKLPSD